MSYQTKYLKYKEKYLKLKKEIKIQEGGIFIADDALVVGASIAATAMILGKRASQCSSEGPQKELARQQLKKMVDDNPVIFQSAALQPIVNSLRQDFIKNKDAILEDLKAGKQHLSSNIKVFQFKDALQKYKRENGNSRFARVLTGAVADNRTPEQQVADNIISSFDCLCNPKGSALNVTTQAVGYIGNALTKSTYLGHVSDPKSLNDYLYDLLNIVNIKGGLSLDSVLLYEHGRVYSKVLACIPKIQKNHDKIDKIDIVDSIPPEYTQLQQGGNIQNENIQDGGNLYNLYGKYIFFYSSEVLDQKSNNWFTKTEYWNLPKVGPAIFNLSSNKAVSNSVNLSLDSITNQMGPTAWYFYLENAMIMSGSTDSYLKNNSGFKVFGGEKAKLIESIDPESKIDTVKFLKNSILDAVNPELFGQFIYINCFMNLIPEYNNRKAIKNITLGEINIDGNNCAFNVENFKVNEDDTITLKIKENGTQCLNKK
jgi:hypothetical protein